MLTFVPRTGRLSASLQESRIVGCGDVGYIKFWGDTVTTANPVLGRHYVRSKSRKVELSRCERNYRVTHLPILDCLSAEWTDYSQRMLPSTSSSAADPIYSRKVELSRCERNYRVTHLPILDCLSAEWTDYSQRMLPSTSSSAADPIYSRKVELSR